MHIDRARFSVIATGFCAFLDLYPTQSMLPELARQFHATEAEVSMTVSATTFGVALMAPFVGFLADRIGRKKVIVGGAILAALPMMLAVFSADIHQLVIWRFLQGLFLPAIFAVAVAHISENWPPHEVADVTGLYVAGSVLGGFSGRFLGGLVGEFLGWRAAFPVLGLLSLACAAFIFYWLPTDRKRPLIVGSALETILPLLRQHWANRALMATFGVGFAVLFSMVAAFTYVNFNLSRPPFNLGMAALGQVFAVYLLGVLVTPMSGPLLRRFGRRRLMMAAVGLGCSGLALTLIPSLPAVVVGLGIFSTCIFICQSLSLGFVGLVAREGKALALGLYVSCYYIGGSLGALLPAGLWTTFGWGGCVALVMVVEALALTVALLTWRDHPLAR